MRGWDGSLKDQEGLDDPDDVNSIFAEALVLDYVPADTGEG